MTRSSSEDACSVYRQYFQTSHSHNRLVAGAQVPFSNNLSIPKPTRCNVEDADRNCCLLGGVCLGGGGGWWNFLRCLDLGMYSRLLCIQPQQTQYRQAFDTLTRAHCQDLFVPEISMHSAS